MRKTTEHPAPVPIRLRILLVSLVAVIAVGTAFYREYAFSRNDVAALRTERTAIREDMAMSKVIHQLQRERGLSAGYLVVRSAEHRQMLAAQRAATDRGLAAAEPLPASRRAALAAALHTIRRGVDDGGADWTQVRDVYTGTITRFLDRIARNGHRAWADAGTAPLYPVNNLAVARENLGLARATLYRIYSRDAVAPAERVALARYYGTYTENLRLFLRDSGTAGLKAFADRVTPALRRQVLGQIGVVLAHGNRLAAGHPDSVAWWSEASDLIDQLKQVEDGIYAAKLIQINKLIDIRRDALLRYTAFAVFSTLLVGLLAFFAVVRILSALSILLQALHTVMEKEDFGIRIPVGAHDEFERIGTSINTLLTYTDTIIRQKDFLASTDLLTNLNNRRRFLELVNQEFLRADRYDNTPAVIICDIDRFKNVNDRFGHATGDTVLQCFAALLRENLRGSDIAARWGGEEFVIMVPNGDTTAAWGLAEKLRCATERMQIAGVDRITASFGLAARGAGQTFESLIKQADQALYAAKLQGRNRVCMETPAESCHDIKPPQRRAAGANAPRTPAVPPHPPDLSQI